MSCILFDRTKKLLRGIVTRSTVHHTARKTCVQIRLSKTCKWCVSIGLRHDHVADSIADPIFRATQDMAVNDKLIAAADDTVKACEAELATLQEITSPESFFQSLWQSRRASTERRRYLLRKMYEAQVKIQTLEKQNTDLKKTLARST